jgi:hypothetical protein
MTEANSILQFFRPLAGSIGVNTHKGEHYAVAVGRFGYPY